MIDLVFLEVMVTMIMKCSILFFCFFPGDISIYFIHEKAGGVFSQVFFWLLSHRGMFD